VENQQPEVLTEEHFAQAAKRQLNQQLSKDELQQIKKDLVGQPVWTQTLTLEELQQGGFGCWGSMLLGLA